MKKNRRDFLKNLLKVGAVAGVASAGALGAKTLSKEEQAKKDALYERTKTWEFYYKQAN